MGVSPVAPEMAGLGSRTLEQHIASLIRFTE